jgi:heme exporter protein D
LHWAFSLADFIFLQEKKIKNGCRIMSNFAFSTLQDFFIMDGHGIYVWSVYLVSLTLIVISFQVTNRKLHQQKIKNAQK